MSIPTFDLMLRPLLALAVTQPITRREAETLMAKHFGLTAEEALQRIPSGASTYVGNRAGWAMSHLTKAGLIERVAPRTYRATSAATSFLVQCPERITVKDLEKLDGYRAAWEPDKEKVKPDDTVAPAEAIDKALEELNTDLRSKLLAAILEQSPEFFEQLVLDVLLKMGYGGSREDAAERLGKSGDEGIDGRINQDALGLDQIMVQAKRYAPDRPIDRTTIQAFIGSLAGQGVTKGIFITTSRFAETAQEFVLRGSSTRIQLIDGQKLVDLMMRHHIGVRVQRTVEVLDLDHNYFEDEE